VHAKSTGELIIGSFGFSDRSTLSSKFDLSETLSESLSPNEKKRLHFLADLWSQSEFRTQRKAQQKTQPKSEMTRSLYARFIFVQFTVLFAHDKLQLVTFVFIISATADCQEA